MGLKIDWVYQAYSEQLPPEDTEFIGFPIMYNLFVVSVLYSNCFLLLLERWVVPNIQIKGFNEAAVQTPTTK